LYTFGDRHRDGAGARVLSVAYLALVREGATSGTGEARWRNCYGYFPWEDWRAGRPEAIDRCISPALGQWAQAATDPAARRARRERAEIVFGLNGAPWDGERVLDRYELLYEAGLVPEAARDPAGRWAARPTAADTPSPTAADTPSPTAADTPSPTDGASRGLLGQAMAADHRRIAATALGRLRGKLRYRPVVFELLPATFTLLQLQRVVEALAGVRLHKQNFRRLVERGRLVEGTGRLQAQTGGRPAELFRFRREVLHERPAPGVGLPELRSATVMAGAKPRG
ncbi:MAG: hypothetical protein M3N52_05990, partial [Actinomycetota bacterium]|nr:hypothetical protein [Actinomycetota bacterium]